ncbi:protein ZBED8-like [Octopus sinensis]|uniref:Protein ZBED8-like n=1 Tax=Octopus sinensis TaxID=2607531 RepID=A0A7E6FEQ8_9MOLL|nr:protein ZBED8-like [Octopus sinensis]
MRLSRLEHHLRTTHPALADKPKAFFETKRHSLKQAKLDGSGGFRQQTSMVVEAAYEISLLIARTMKNHSVGESLIKPSLLRAAELVLGKYSTYKLSQISLSNDRVNRRIDDFKDHDEYTVLRIFYPSVTSTAGTDPSFSNDNNTRN